MTGKEMIDRLQEVDTSSLEQVYRDMPIYMYQIGKKVIIDSLNDGIKYNLEPDDIYMSMFLAGVMAAKLSQKIELEDLMINADNPEK